MNFYISHIPSEESTRLFVAYAKALISEDLGLEGMWLYRIIIYFNNKLKNKIIYGRKKQETLRGTFDEGI